MDQAAEPVPSQNPDIRALGGWMLASGGRALVEGPVRAMDVMVIDVLVGAGNCVTSCDLRVFVDQATEPVPAEDPDVCA